VKGTRVDGRTFLIVAKGWEHAAAHCTACHSGKLVRQNSGTREHWLDMIRWMQRTQNLWQLPADVEEQILDYLAANYGPRQYARRAPLDPWMLPPDPPGTKPRASKAPRDGAPLERAPIPGR
jgi:hypothetical protein